MIYGATLVSQIVDSSATAVVPLPETVKRKNMVMLLVAFAVIFGLVLLAGCVFQCGWRQLRRRWRMRSTERPAVPTPASPPPPPPTTLQPTGSPSPTLRARSVAEAKVGAAPKSAAESVRARGRLAVATTPGLSGALPLLTEPEMTEPPLPAPTPRAPEAPRVTCPLCEAEMTFKRARAGGCFHGCNRYPLCSGSRRPNFSEP